MIAQSPLKHNTLAVDRIEYMQVIFLSVKLKGEVMLQNTKGRCEAQEAIS